MKEAMLTSFSVVRNLRTSVQQIPQATRHVLEISKPHETHQ